MCFLFFAEVQQNLEQQTGWADKAPLFLAVGLAGFLLWRFLIDRTTPPSPQPRLRSGVISEKSTVNLRARAAPPRPIYLSQSPSPVGTPENRKHLRRDGGPVEVLISDAQAKAEPKPGSVINRSVGGLRLQVSEPATVGTTLCVRAVLAPEEVPWVRLKVKSCRQQGNYWELGGMFEAELPWSVLLLFG
jgi:hypothetical protein